MSMTAKPDGPMLRCSSCGRECAGKILSPGCRSAKCDRCFNDPAAAADATHVPAPRKRGNRIPPKPSKRRK